MKVRELIPFFLTGKRIELENALAEIAANDNTASEEILRSISQRVEELTGEREVSTYLELNILTEIINALHLVATPGARLLRYYAQKRIILLHSTVKT